MLHIHIIYMFALKGGLQSHIGFEVPLHWVDVPLWNYGESGWEQIDKWLCLKQQLTKKLLIDGTHVLIRAPLQKIFFKVNALHSTS